MNSRRLARRTPEHATFPARGTYAEARRIGSLLRKETVGGALLSQHVGGSLEGRRADRKCAQRLEIPGAE